MPEDSEETEAARAGMLRVAEHRELVSRLELAVGRAMLAYGRLDQGLWSALSTTIGAVKIRDHFHERIVNEANRSLIEEGQTTTLFTKRKKVLRVRTH